MEKTAADWVPEVPQAQADGGRGRHVSRQRRRAARPARSSSRRTSRARSARSRAAAATRSTAARSRARSSTTARRTAASSRWRTSRRRSRDWVEPISTTYRGHTLYELPPNGQGLTALLLLNILEGIDLTSMRTEPVRYYHTLIEATKIAFADRNRYIADPAFAKVPVKELLLEGLRGQPARAHRSEQGDRSAGVRRHPASAATRPISRSSTRTATPSRSSTASSTRSDPAIVAGDTGIMLQNRGAGFSLEPDASQPLRARQTAVPHAHPRDGVQGRQAPDVVRRDGRRHPAAGTRAGAGQPDRSRAEPAAGDRRAARALHQRPRRDDGGRPDRAGDRRAHRARPRARPAASRA